MLIPIELGGGGGGGGGGSGPLSPLWICAFNI